MTIKKRIAKRLSQQSGYSLLALIIVIAITAVYLASTLDTFHAETMRDKEEEFIFRGEEMARAIARYNNANRLLPLRQGGPLPTKLEDLVKQSNVNGQKLVYSRKFALQDILSGDDEWQPVRAGDPRIGEYLQNWAAYYSSPIPNQYLLFAGTTDADVNGGSAGSFNPANGTVGTNGSNNANNDDDDEDDEDDDDDDEDESGQVSPSNGTAFNNNQNNGSAFNSNGKAGNYAALDEDQRPIIGVVSKNKGKAYRRLYGKDVTYDKWLFIFIPPTQAGLGGIGGTNNGGINGQLPPPPLTPPSDKPPRDSKPRR